MEKQKKMKNVRKHNCRGELCSPAWNKPEKTYVQDVGAGLCARPFGINVLTNQTHGVILIALIVTILLRYDETTNYSDTNKFLLSANC